MTEKVVIAGEAYPLRERCEEVVQFDATLATFIDDLTDTMRSHHVLGLSAPQVGATVQVIVVDTGQGTAELVNPTLTHVAGHQDSVECCASFPDTTFQIGRPDVITVKAKDRRGADVSIEAKGVLARVICHELDHLQGILFYDHLDEGELLFQMAGQGLSSEADDCDEWEPSLPVPADELAELEAARMQEKAQVVDMLADASWKLLLAIELLEEASGDSLQTDTSALRKLADELRAAVDEWEDKLLN